MITSQLIYTVEVNWKMLTRARFELAPSDKLASNPSGLDSSNGKAADRYSEGPSSNPARVNIFQLTSTV